MNILSLIKHSENEVFPTAYIQIWKNRIRITDPETGAHFDETPLVAIKTTRKGKKSVAAAGNEVHSDSSNKNHLVVNPFLHPRTLLNDFNVAEKLLQHILQKLHKNKYTSPRPSVIIHPMEETEGGLTQIEKKAFKELALGAGARKVVLHQGDELSTSKMISKRWKEANHKNEADKELLAPKTKGYLAAFALICLIFFFYIPIIANLLL